MRRSDREVTDRAEIARIIASCDCCRVGFAAEDGVYIVPLNFAYVETGALGALYFHGAKEGRKAGLIAARPKAGFEMDCGHRLNASDRACGYSFAYKSVIGTGVIAPTIGWPTMLPFLSTTYVVGNEYRLAVNLPASLSEANQRLE